MLSLIKGGGPPKLEHVHVTYHHSQLHLVIQRILTNCAQQNKIQKSNKTIKKPSCLFFHQLLCLIGSPGEVSTVDQSLVEQFWFHQGKAVTDHHSLSASSGEAPFG